MGNLPVLQEGGARAVKNCKKVDSVKFSKLIS